MEFLDRVKETAMLKRTLNLEREAVVVIYGRRRVGKSTLLKHVLTPRDVYHLSEEAQSRVQIDSFAHTVAFVFEDFDQVVYPTWESVLTAINRFVKEKITVCIDEFAYLVKSDPTLPSVLQRLIDNHVLKYNLVLCGSSQRMMHGLVLNEDAPLYQRTDWQPRIRQLKLPYIKQALHCSDVEAVEEYAVWGGVPRYWVLRADYGSLDEALRNLLVDSNGVLQDEPQRLLRDERRDTAMASSLLDLIGNGANRLAEIASRLQQPATNLSQPLSLLIDLDYVERETPFDAPERSGKKSLYRLADNFLAFFYRFIQPNKSLISLDRKDLVMDIIHKSFPIHVGQVWEKMCREFVAGRTIDGITYGMAHRWWGSLKAGAEGKREPAEIDIVAASLDGKHLLVGECKWRNIDDIGHLAATLTDRAHRLPFIKPGQTVHPVLFLKTPPRDCPLPYFTPRELITQQLTDEESIS